MATDPATQTLSKQQTDALTSIANASILVRDAVSDALPVSPEQYLTISVPGTVIDTTDIAKGGSFVYDAVNTPFTPTAVLQAEARLVDGMMPLAKIMVSGYSPYRALFSRLIRSLAIRVKVYRGATQRLSISLYPKRPRSLPKIRSEVLERSRTMML
jgi:hypothetical protein